MSSWPVILLSLALLLPSPVDAQGTDCDIEGHWHMETREWDVRIEPREEAWEGEIVESADPAVEPGTQLFQELTSDGEEEGFSGTMVRPDSGREVSVEIVCEDEDTLEVTARIAFLRRSFLLERVDPEDG